MKIIFAQGNPEPRYSGTRHNVGFAVLNELAHNLNLKWEDRPKFSAHTAEATIAGEKVLLVKPTTYYNETGLSARKIIDFYKLDPTADLIVIHDDLALEFGIIRVRQGGRDAGNNGIKSVIAHLGENFTRVRIGTLTEQHNRASDSDYVTSKFSSDETTIINDKIIPTAIDVIERFCQGNIRYTSYNL